VDEKDSGSSHPAPGIGQYGSVFPEEESATLLAKLFHHSVEDRFIYRHRWQPFDLVMWDNRSTQHLATGCPPHLRRTLYRTTVRGDVPAGARVPRP
jgi:taurine dioxygenase